MDGKGIRQALQELDISQSTFANDLGFSLRTVQNWLSKKNANRHLSNPASSLKILKYLAFKCLAVENVDVSGEEVIAISDLKERLAYTIKLACDFTPFYNIILASTSGGGVEEERFSHFLERVMLHSNYDYFQAHSFFTDVVDVAEKCYANSREISKSLNDEERITSRIESFLGQDRSTFKFYEKGESELEDLSLEQLMEQINEFEGRLMDMLNFVGAVRGYLDKHKK